MLNAFAVGPPVLALTYSAIDGYPVGGASPPSRFVASMITLPRKPVTPARAAGTAWLGTASNTTPASAASPPALPSWVTSCPAEVHSRASVPPIMPLPIVVTFIECSPFERVRHHGLSREAGRLIPFSWEHAEGQPVVLVVSVSAARARFSTQSWWNRYSTPG